MKQPSLCGTCKTVEELNFKEEEYQIELKIKRERTKNLTQMNLNNE